MRSVPLLVFGLVAVVVAACATDVSSSAGGTSERPPARLAVTNDQSVSGLPDSIGDLLERHEDVLPATTLPPIPTPTPRPTATPVPAPVYRVPVLMYHYISAVPADQASNRFAVDLRVPPDLFEQHLSHLKSQGYTSISTPDLWNAINGKESLPARPVVLTFDDGYADAYTNALPLLLKYGFRGTFFITCNLVGKPGYMSWDQVQALEAAGMDVESHAMDHWNMAALSGAKLSYEMNDSRAMLSSKIGRDVRFFAYPSGDYNAVAIQGAIAAGYYAAFAKSGGSSQSLDWAYALHRTRVSGYANLDTFKNALAY